jgi:quercetin dioxygenase-like cupin family protein
MSISGPLNWDQMEWEFVRPGVKRKVFQAERCTMVLNYLEPGHEPKPHSHSCEQLVYIMQGVVDFTVGTRTFTLQAGGLLTVPANLEHFAKVTGKETAIDLDVFVPRREDYVQSKIKGRGQ